MGRRFPYFILIAVACFIVCGCARKENSASAITVTAEYDTPVSTTEDKTDELKNISFNNFEGKTMEDIATDDAKAISFDEFFNLAGLDYATIEKDIVVAPINYNKESDFAIQIHVQSNGIISGYNLSKGRAADNTWKESRDFESATDFIFDMVLGDEKYLIGADAMDALWRDVRVLTAPEDKVEVVNAAVDAELASYYELPEDFIFPEE